MHTYSIPNSEIKVIKESLLKASKVLFSGGAKNIYLVKSNEIEQMSISNYQNKIESISKTHEIKFSAVHVLGGVKSGENVDCVADSFGKIRKYKNLYINDSSLLNENLLRNPQGTVMLIAKRNIEKFLSEKK